MELTEADILNNDYDWFVIINNVPVHVASDGTPLPSFIARNFDTQISARKKIVKLPKIIPSYNVLINSNLPQLTGILQYSQEYNHVVAAYYVYKGYNVNDFFELYDYFGDNFNFDETFNGINNIDILRIYLASIYIPEFLKFGERGFLSFDHTITENHSNTHHWVVNPGQRMIHGIESLELPSFILDPEDSFDSLFEETVDIVALVNKYLQ